MDARISARRKFASGVVLFVLTLERLAYYALISTFYLFLNKGPWSVAEGWDSLDALNAVFVVLGVSYISALLGGYISDAWTGRFRAIVFGMILYILGYILLILITVDKLPRYICSGTPHHSHSNATLSAAAGVHEGPHAPCKPAVYMAIVVLGTGVGMVKANIGPFGAEQLGPSNPSVTRSFFNWYYWCTNVGSFVGIGVLAFVEQDNPGVCSNGFFCGYLIAAVCLALALLILLSLCALFERHPASGNSPLFNILRITWEATRIKLRDVTRSREQHNNSAPLVQPKFLDLAKVRYGGRFHESAVDDVRAVGSMLALFAALIPYWLVYFQMQTSFQAQGLHMRFMLDFNSSSSSNNNNASSSDGFTTAAEHLSDHVLEGEGNLPRDQWTFSVPAAWLTLFNQVFLIVALPVLTKFLYPYLDRRGIRLSMLSRIGVGMFVSSLAVFTAGGLETIRTMMWQTDNSTHIVQTVGNATFNAVDLSIFWQVPQYVLVAGAEALASIAGLEYAYSEAPRSFQSLTMGLFYAMEGVGSFLGIALLQMLAPFWLNNMTDYANINDNHLDFYLYFLGIIQLLTLIVYGVTIYVARFSLELVPLHSNEGIGGPMDRGSYTNRFGSSSSNNNSSRRGLQARGGGGGHLTNYRQLREDDNYEERLRRTTDDSSPGGRDHQRRALTARPANERRGWGADDRDEELIDVHHPNNEQDLMPLDESDDSVGVNDAPMRQ